MAAEDRVEVVIIGAGIVGCSLAYEFARKGKLPLVVEAGPRIAEGVTSRNSGVVHAGIYYPPASLKAQSCIRGKALLYEWCQEKSVSHKQLGKWIVGGRDEEPDLRSIYENALASGATGLSWGKTHELERDLPGVTAAQVGVFSSETGIIDPFEYALSFRAASEEKGAQFVFGAKVMGIARMSSGGYEIETTRGKILADCVVNSAGLHADEVARLVGIGKYRVHPCRGDYFRLTTQTRYPHLIYPVKRKNDAGLGVHLTIGLDGVFRLGPDFEFVDSKEDLSAPLNLEKKRRAFYEASSKFLSEISIEQLRYDGCGIRPKLRAPDEKQEKDFVLSEDLPGFVNLVGIESPGLTAARDLAQRAANLLFA